MSCEKKERQGLRSDRPSKNWCSVSPPIPINVRARGCGRGGGTRPCAHGARHPAPAQHPSAMAPPPTSGPLAAPPPLSPPASPGARPPRPGPASRAMRPSGTSAPGAALATAAVLCALRATCAAGVRSRWHLLGGGPAAAGGGDYRVGADPRMGACDERFFNQQLDHFRYTAAAERTWPQRYFLCEEAWGRRADSPVFYYGATLLELLQGA